MSDWTIGRDAAGTWLRCRLELPAGGAIKVDAPTLDAIRIMEKIDDALEDDWLEAAEKAAAQ